MKTRMILTGITAGLLCSACSQQLPLISHAHVGHALTAWKDTPDEQGLFLVAESEMQKALQETHSAIAAGRSQSVVDRNLVNILKALNPDLGPRTDSSYGAIRALQGATDHMVFASESDDASENIKQMVQAFENAQPAVIARMKLAVKQTQTIMQTDVTERQDLLAGLRSNISAIIDGVDLDQDGSIGSRNDEYGLQQLRSIISAGLKKERPAYHPVGKKYLLGLVRLPDGGWAYRFNTSSPQGQSGYDYSGYSY